MKYYVFHKDRIQITFSYTYGLSLYACQPCLPTNGNLEGEIEDWKDNLFLNKLV